MVTRVNKEHLSFETLLNLHQKKTTLNQESKLPFLFFIRVTTWRLYNQWSVVRNEAALQAQAVPLPVTDPPERTQENPKPLDTLPQESEGKRTVTRLSKISRPVITNLCSKRSTMCDKLQTSKDGSVDLCHGQLAGYSQQQSIQQYSRTSNSNVYSSSNRKQRKNYSKG